VLAKSGHTSVLGFSSLHRADTLQVRKASARHVLQHPKKCSSAGTGYPSIGGRGERRDGISGASQEEFGPISRTNQGCVKAFIPGREHGRLARARPRNGAWILLSAKPGSDWQPSEATPLSIIPNTRSKVMSTISTAATHQGTITSGTIATVVRVLKTTWMACIDWRENIASIAELRAMSDCELKDIGLLRSDIGRRAAEE
jgi:uncharacterized protein YjiS (DUF1127 family)